VNQDNPRVTGCLVRNGAIWDNGNTIYTGGWKGNYRPTYWNVAVVCWDGDGINSWFRIWGITCGTPQPKTPIIEEYLCVPYTLIRLVVNRNKTQKLRGIVNSPGIPSASDENCNTSNAPRGFSKQKPIF